jgi:hypothetical protein
MGRQNITVDGHGGAKLLSHGGQEAERGTEEEAGTRYIFLVICSDLFPPRLYLLLSTPPLSNAILL